MKRLTYPVKEAFYTIQGEGVHSGAAAVFVRFVGCNVWSGRSKDRERDTAKGCCAAWCDTDFVGTNGVNGGSYSGQDLALLVQRLRGQADIVVVTGGEPSLTLDEALVGKLHELGMRVHVETNGSRALPPNVDWVTLSPKPPMRVEQQHFDEVKVVYPAGFNPLAYAHCATSRFIQPLDAADPLSNAANMRKCVEFVMANRGWRLGLQTHKLAGVA